MRGRIRNFLADVVGVLIIAGLFTAFLWVTP